MISAIFCADNACIAIKCIQFVAAYVSVTICVIFSFSIKLPFSTSPTLDNDFDLNMPIILITTGFYF